MHVYEINQELQQQTKCDIFLFIHCFIYFLAIRNTLTAANIGILHQQYFNIEMLKFLEFRLKDAASYDDESLCENNEAIYQN